jgi:hypothetical protein
MTDISESGIEAALDASYAGKTVLRLLVDGWDAHVPVEDRWRITEDIVKTAIQAYLPFHPPEEGLRVDLALIEATARKINPGRSEDHIKSVALDALTIFRALQGKKPE